MLSGLRLEQHRPIVSSSTASATGDNVYQSEVVRTCTRATSLNTLVWMG